MPYSSQTWADGPGGGTPLSAARLQHIEDGVAASVTEAASLYAPITVTGHPVLRVGDTIRSVGFSATCDFRVSDYASADLAVVAAVASLPAGYSGGGEIILRAGTYNFVTGVDCSALHNIRIRGEGQGTIVGWTNSNTFTTNTAASNWLFTTGDYCSITDMQLSGRASFVCTINGVNTYNAGSGTNTLGGGIRVGGSRVWVQRVTVNNMAEDGITQYSGVSNGRANKLTDLYVIGCGGIGLNLSTGQTVADNQYSNIWVGSCNQGITIAGGTARMSNFHSWGNQTTGVTITSHYNQLSNGYVESNGQWGVLIGGYNGNALIGCDIWNNGSTDPVNYGGMNIGGTSIRNRVIGCSFRDNVSNGLLLNSTAKYNIFSFNTFSDSLAAVQTSTIATTNYTTGVATASSTTFTDASANFSTAFHINRTIVITGAGAAGAVLTTTIAAVTNATTITLAVAASTSVNPATYKMFNCLYGIRETASSNQNILSDNVINTLEVQNTPFSTNTGIAGPRSAGVGNMGYSAQALSSIGSKAVAFSIDARSGSVFTVTLTATPLAVTIFPATPISGQQITLIITQDATANRQLTWPATMKVQGGAFTLSSTPNAINVISFVFDGTNWIETSRS